jgi:SnoaL-like domain
MQYALTAVQNLLAQLFIALDDCNYDALTGCFTQDGTWTRQGATLRRDEIKKALDARPATLKTIHVLSNILLEAETQDGAAGRFYLTVYRHDADTPPPYPVPKPAVVGLCKAEFVQVQTQWLIRQLQTGPYVFAN